VCRVSAQTHGRDGWQTSSGALGKVTVRTVAPSATFHPAFWRGGGIYRTRRKDSDGQTGYCHGRLCHSLPACLLDIAGQAAAPAAQGSLWSQAVPLSQVA